MDESEMESNCEPFTQEEMELIADSDLPDVQTNFDYDVEELLKEHNFKGYEVLADTLNWEHFLSRDLAEAIVKNEAWALFVFSMNNRHFNSWQRCVLAFGNYESWNERLMTENDGDLERMKQLQIRSEWMKHEFEYQKLEAEKNILRKLAKGVMVESIKKRM